MNDFVHILEVANCFTAPKHAESERHLIGGFMSADLHNPRINWSEALHLLPFGSILTLTMPIMTLG